MTSAERAIALWFPDWSVTAFLRASAHEIDGPAPEPDAPIALVRANRVVACASAARAAGVQRGQRRRDAQSACPGLILIPADAGRDERAFAEALRVVERLSPGVQELRPGLAMLRARGPARFYGGEAEAARAIADPLRDAGFADVRFGVADGVFTAEQAARGARAGSDGSPHLLLVEPGESAAFLSPLPVSALDDDDTAELLTRLGVHTIGDFASLAEEHVHERFSERGAFLHACSRGSDPRGVTPHAPPPDLARELVLEPPLELAEQVAFAARRTAEAFHAGLGDAGLICTAVRVTLLDERDRRSERVWQHPSAFDAAGIVDRIRWQLQETGGEAAGRAGTLDGSIAFLRLEPEAADDASAHQPALVGQGPGERAHHTMTRLQAVFGHRGVLSPEVAGGRGASEREVLRPWGDAPEGGMSAGGPWPGSLPAPLPAEIFRPPLPAEVRAAGGAACTVDGRGLLSAAPATLDGRRIVAWAGPWPLVERDWDAARRRRVHRFQLVTDAGTAWLASLEHDGWRLEGRYG